MKAYMNEKGLLTIEDGNTTYEFFENDQNMIDSCDDWTHMDCKNYLKHNEPVNVKPKMTYDVVFNDDNKSDCNGFRSSLQYCKDYIEMYNGKNESYFMDYKGGTVSVRCNETGEDVFVTEVI